MCSVTQQFADESLVKFSLSAYISCFLLGAEMSPYRILSRYGHHTYPFLRMKIATLNLLRKFWNKHTFLLLLSVPRSLGWLSYALFSKHFLISFQVSFDLKRDNPGSPLFPTSSYLQRPFFCSEYVDKLSCISFYGFDTKLWSVSRSDPVPWRDAFFSCLLHTCLFETPLPVALVGRS